HILLLLAPPTPPTSTLSPYTTLFRSPKAFGLDPLRDVQVLTPMNRNSLGTEALNQCLQGVLNSNPGAGEVERFGMKLRAGDKVLDRKSTRLNSSHQIISYAVFCLKKK